MKTMSREPPYWSEWANKIITRYSLKPTSKGAKEYHGPCPSCGGVDRFWINEYQGEVKVHCRQCGEHGWKDIIAELEHDGCWPIWNAPLRSLDNVVQLSPEFNEEQDPFQPYHERKGVTLVGAKLDGLDVVVPLFNAEKERVGYQRITPDGIKKFNRGLDKAGGVFGVCGKGMTDGDTVYLAEGWATSASVWEATGRPCIFGLDAANLQTVCEAFSIHFPDIPIVVAGDHDAKGIECAKACNKPYVVPTEAGADWNDVHQKHGIQAVKDGLAKVVRPSNPTDKLVWLGDAEAVLTSNYSVKGWFGREQMWVIYGQSNVGKSFFMLDVAYHIADGRDWNGCKVKQGVVLYLATEGGNAFRNRAKALAEHYQADKVPLAIRPSPVNLLDPNADLPQLLELVKLVTEQHGQIELIVIDTLSRAMAGGNENAPEAMTAVISNADVLREAAACSVAIVHHSGKANDGARGHSSLRAATDTEVELWTDTESGLRTAKATKQRDMETGKELCFDLKVIELGMDQDGDQVTSCVISPASDDRRAEVRVKLTKNEKLFVECFTQLQGEQIGKLNPSGAGWPESGTRWVIEEDTVREHFYGKTEAKNKRQSFTRAVEGLYQKQQITKNEGHFWLTAPKHKIRGSVP